MRSPGTLARSYSSFAIRPTIAREGGLGPASNRSAIISPLTRGPAVQGDPATVPRRARISHLSAADRLTRIAQAAHSETATGSPTWVNFARSSIQIRARILSRARRRICARVERLRCSRLNSRGRRIGRRLRKLGCSNRQALDFHLCVVPAQLDEPPCAPIVGRVTRIAKVQANPPPPNTAAFWAFFASAQAAGQQF